MYKVVLVNTKGEYYGGTHAHSEREAKLIANHLVENIVNNKLTDNYSECRIINMTSGYQEEIDIILIREEV